MSCPSRSAWRSVQEKLTSVNNCQLLRLSVHAHIVTPQLTNSAEESAPWEANSSLASHEIFYIYGNRRFVTEFTTACNFSPFQPYVVITRPLYIFFCNFHFNIVFASTTSKRCASAFRTTTVSSLPCVPHVLLTIRSGEEYRSRSSALRSFLQSPPPPRNNCYPHLPTPHA